MNTLSDLELVAQSMAQEPPKANTAAHSGSLASNNVQSTEQIPPTEESNSTSSLDLDNLNLSSLSPEDRIAFQPIIDALRASKDENLDIDEIMAQMDAAGHVADQLEERLDRLLATLNEDGEALEQKD